MRRNPVPSNHVLNNHGQGGIHCMPAFQQIQASFARDPDPDLNSEYDPDPVLAQYEQGQ